MLVVDGGGDSTVAEVDVDVETEDPVELPQAPIKTPIPATIEIQARLPKFRTVKYCRRSREALSIGEVSK